MSVPARPAGNGVATEGEWTSAEGTKVFHSCQWRTSRMAATTREGGAEMERRERMVKDMVLGLGKEGTGRGVLVRREVWFGGRAGREGRVKEDILVVVVWFLGGLRMCDRWWFEIAGEESMMEELASVRWML